MTEARNNAPSSRGYWLALAGGLAGALLAGFTFVTAISILGLVGAGIGLGPAIYGQIAAVPIGSAAGISAMLAISKRRAATATGLISLPVTIVLFVAVWGLMQVVDTMDFGWLIVIPPFIVPLVSRWIALRVVRDVPESTPPLTYRKTPSDVKAKRSRWFVGSTIAILLLVGSLWIVGQLPINPTSGSVVEARIQEMERLRSELDVAGMALDGQVLGESLIDYCYEGQRNYKVDTGYNHRCSLVMGTLFSLDGDFRNQLARLDITLSAHGWEASSWEKWPGRFAEKHWDRVAENPEQLYRLPTGGGVRRDGLWLNFFYGTVSDEQGLVNIDRGQQRAIWCCWNYYKDEQLIELDRVGELALHENLILVTIEGHYFQK